MSNYTYLTWPLQILFFALACMIAVPSAAWDTTPDEEGLYDGLYDRPTYFPEWEQPETWPNAMYILCDVREGSEDGARVPSYEVAVYDAENALRHCGRSLAKQDHYCVLTLRGEDGEDEFHFQVIYGEDFAHPLIVDIDAPAVPFETNRSIGTKADPFLLVIPMVPSGIGSVPPSDISTRKMLRDGRLVILRNGVEYNAGGGRN
jgi:hypothetical protein